MNLKEKKLILKKYENDIFKILCYENLLIKENDYNFINNFIKDLLILNYDYLEIFYLKENLNKKEIKEIINNIQIKYTLKNYDRLYYNFIIEILLKIIEKNNLKINENEIKSIKRKMKNLINYKKY